MSKTNGSSLRIFLVVSFVILLSVSWQASGQTNTSSAVGSVPPVSWVDQDTGHRVVRLTDQPGSRGLYFNWNAFTPDGKQMVYEANRSIYLLDLSSRKSRILVSGPVSAIVVSKTTPAVYFMKSSDKHIYMADVSTGELSQIGVIPVAGIIETINTNGTLLAGYYMDDPTSLKRLSLAPEVKPSKKARERQRFDAHLPMTLFVFDLRNASVTPILHTTDWLNHVQFSPTDPTLLMYCHEGPWNEVDRIWTIRADGSNNTSIHKRGLAMKDETAGHEFWDADGKTIWYDLQAPKGQAFFLASYNTETGERRHYQMNRSQWSIHFNGDLSSGLFCGDGGSSFGAASSAEGQWIELFRPKLTGSSDANASGAFKTGIIESERLVNLSNQDYSDEPNVHFSPDHKLVIFTSNMFGPDYVFGVEVARTPGFKPNAAMTHTFTSAIADASENISEATIQVVDQSNVPVANAQVAIKSLDTGRQVGVFTTDQNGKTQPVALDKDLHRFSVICSSGACGTTIQELYTAPFPGNLVIQANSSSVDQSSVPAAKKVKIVVQDTNRNPLPNIQVLVRTADAAQEAWYTTGRDGAANIAATADPSLLTAFVKFAPHVFKLASACGPAGDTNSQAVQCVQMGDSVVLTIPRP
jgi:oligogalacturonide lyase